MQGKQRRGHRPIVTTLVSERRIPGGREFIFTSIDPEEGPETRSGRALKTARAFSWEDAPAANDATRSPGKPQPADEADYAQFLRGLRSVYRGKRRPR
jgi:hypothetical protein